ncbi:multidrug effflux MFS transporter [Roseovarius sp.]|uniref:multidrug effflux MFS transporter n=1 Tax=Roseovarius sp. TaxID=1486281 RepID=UPI003BA975D3
MTDTPHGAPPAQTAADPITPPPRRFLDRTTPPHVLTLITLSALAALAMNIFLPSLPAMATHFGTDYRVMQLSVALYLGVNAVLQLFVGAISDRIGRRPVLLAGVAIFLLATLGCIFATSTVMFLVFRMFQAAIVTALVLSRAVVRDMVPEAQAASMIGYVTMGMAVAPMVGPAIGGGLASVFGWQAGFWALFVIGCVTLWLTWSDLGETAPSRAGTTFRDELRDYPELLKSPRFWGYTATLGLSSGSFFAYLGGAPYVGDQVFGLDQATFGLFFGAPAVGYFCGNFLAGRFSVQVGINRMVLWGSMIVAAGVSLSLLLFELGLGTPYTFFGLMTCVGLGNGMAIPNATSGALSVRPHLAGTASGLSGSLMIGLGAGLSALAGALLTPGAGAAPLLWIMVVTAIGAICSIGLVIRREKRLALGG